MPKTEIRHRRNIWQIFIGEVMKTLRQMIRNSSIGLEKLHGKVIIFPLFILADIMKQRGNIKMRQIGTKQPPS